jgi:hypothetical protein
METKGITQVAKNLGGMITRNSPTILTGVAVAGLVTTTVLGIRATPKALALIDDYVWNKYETEVEDQEEMSFAEWLGVDTDGYSWRDKTNYLSRKETIKLTWKTYVPTVAVGTITIACIIGANHISLRRNAALASLYGLTEAAFKEYQTKVVETIGKNKELKIRDEVSADRLKKNPPGANEVIFTGKGVVLCYDSLSGRYFKSDIEQIRRAVNELNRDLMSDMFLSVNEFYYAIGLSGIKLGDQMGWDIDKGLLEIDFSAQLSDEGEPCLVLNYSIEPRYMK